jgi:hypothetical protein
MKNAFSTAAILAGIILPATFAHADVKNAAGAVCMRYASSEAPKTAEYVTSTGQMCNDSGTERLRVLCPIVQDEGTGKGMHVSFDYENWNLNGINGNEDDHPEEEFKCSVFTRTRYAEAYYWGEWKSAAEFPGYGATPTAMYAEAKMLDDGFSTGICYIPRKVTSRSCVSHLRSNEY